jgi:4-hydroxybenzoate polyprenyltransferase
MKSTLYLIFVSMRPKQWVKNGLLFIPLLFSQNILNFGMLAINVTAFFIFCLLSSGIYLLNDLFDIEKDKRHPAKARRPLASAALSPGMAKMALVIVFILSIVAACFINLSFGHNRCVFHRRGILFKGNGGRESHRCADLFVASDLYHFHLPFLRLGETEI